MISAEGLWAAAGDRPSASAGTLGSRGSRSHSAPARPAPERPEQSPAPVTAPPAPARRFGGRWIGVLAGSAAGSLIGGAFFGISWGLLDLVIINTGIVLLATFLLRRRAAPAQPMQAALRVPRGLEAPLVESSLDRGVREIRQTDAKFDPARLAGYTGMVFRDVQIAWMTRDIDSLRDRLSPEMYGELQARCGQLRQARQLNRIDGIEIRAEITEAWQESDQDYVTACIAGSMVDYIVDEVTGGVVNGSSAIPKDVEEFWTFTRPAGLNFWMLSAIQTSSVPR
jgi:predicted lipid-binding transport protein (Tim44 family)